MRVIADVNTDRIIQVTSTPPDNGTTSMNGRYVVPIPEGVSIPVTSASYLTPDDAGSIPGLAAAGLLARYPMYDYEIHNFGLTSADTAMWDLTGPATYPTPPFGYTFVAPRCSVGRAAGPAGFCPNAVAILPAANNRPAPEPGLLVTDTIDISAILPGGTDEVLIWWRIAKMSVSEDIVAGYGVTAGLNEPAIKSLDEFEQEPTGFSVHASNDDGATWYDVTRLQPIDLVALGTDLRFAFVNTNTFRIYLQAFVALYPTP